MTDWLPEEFKREMEDMLGGEYGAYLESFGRPVSRGLRVNTLKWDRLECMEKLPCKTEPVPWIANGLFYEDEVPAACGAWGYGPGSVRGSGREEYGAGSQA